MPSRITPFLLIALSAAAAPAASISVNFNISGNDNNAVDSDESATSIYAGANWNNLVTRASGQGVVEDAFALFSHSLNDDTGSAAATLATTIATGGGFSEFSDVSPAGPRGAFGEAGMMQSTLNFGGAFPSEVVTITGLGPAFTANGYYVIAYFDLGDVNRTYGLTVDDGSASETYWTQDISRADAGGTDSDNDDDGIMEWTLSTGTNSAEATPDANYAVFRGFSNASFTISGVSTGGRAVMNGLQIVALPEPSSAALALAAALGCALRRRR